MSIKRGLRAVGAFLGRDQRRAHDKPALNEVERNFRQIWHYLVIGSDQRYPLKRGQTNALVLQMGKVASTSIRAALGERGINAFHSHGLSSAPQHWVLSQLLERDLTFRLVAHDLRHHIQHVALSMMIRWYRRHKEYNGRRLKVITLTRDPVTRYPSDLAHRYDSLRPDLAAWYRARLGLRENDLIDEAQVLPSFMMELASIIALGQPSTSATGPGRCVTLAQERWPEHLVVAAEVGTWLWSLSWFDREITPVFGIDLLASSELRERGWAERNNDWVEILVLKFEELSSLIPQIQRFFDLAELTLPRENITSAKASGTKLVSAMRSVLDTSVGKACAHELRMSSYARACGYDAAVPSQLS